MSEENSNEEGGYGVFNIELLNLKRGLHTLTHLDSSAENFLLSPQEIYINEILTRIEILLIQLGPKLGEDREKIRSEVKKLRTRTEDGWEKDKQFKEDIRNLVEQVNKSAYDNGILSASTGEIEDITL